MIVLIVVILIVIVFMVTFVVAFFVVALFVVAFFVVAFFLFTTARGHRPVARARNWQASWNLIATATPPVQWTP